jgi:hypothetical protein
MVNFYINRPLSKRMNSKISSMLTFLFSGLILHDIWIMPLFYILFKKIAYFPVTFIFLGFWIVMILENSLKLRRHVKSDKIHVFINIVYVLGVSAVGGIISALITKY